MDGLRDTRGKRHGVNESNRPVAHLVVPWRLRIAGGQKNSSTSASMVDSYNNNNTENDQNGTENRASDKSGLLCSKLLLLLFFRSQLNIPKIQIREQSFNPYVCHRTSARLLIKSAH